VQRYSSWFPLGVSALVLLLGFLPMVSMTTASRVHMSVYQMGIGAILQFAAAPVIVAIIWAIDFFMRDFGKFAKFAITAAAAVQVVSICLLLHIAAGYAAGYVSIYSPDEIPPQMLGIGAWLLLAVSGLFLVSCGLQLTKKQRKAQPAAPVMPVAPVMGPNV